MSSKGLTRRELFSFLRRPEEQKPRTLPVLPPGLTFPLRPPGARSELRFNDLCERCGKCVEACPVDAMTLVSANDPRRPKLRRAKLDEDTCLGCGVCVRSCARGGLHLRPRAERVIPPQTSAHRVVLMAIERGKLQHLLFDDRALLSHRAMAAILAVILRLPPLKQRLANRQLRSRYVDRLLASSAKRNPRRAGTTAPREPTSTLH